MKTGTVNYQIIVIHGRFANNISKDLTLIILDGCAKTEITLIQGGHIQKTKRKEFTKWQQLQTQGLKLSQK